MNKNTNSNNNNNKATINTRRKRRNRVTRRRIIRRRINRAIRNGRRRRMPIATTISIPKFFRTIKTNGTSVTVSGCDLIYSIPNTTEAQNQSTTVISMIPANPAYWTGTRIAALAASYQNYRPVSLQFIYVPMCATTQQGNVIAGTFWNEVPSSENLQQSLKTSNGGIITQAFKPATSVVRLRSNLQFNLYRMGGQINQQSNPFMFIALAVACTNGNNQIVPGYFYVKYKYILKNPLGTGITYGNSQITTVQAKTAYYTNAIYYLLSEVKLSNEVKLPVGTQIDVEYNNSDENPGYNYYYNDTPVDIPYETPIWVLENQARQVAAMRLVQKITTKHIIYWQYKIPADQNFILGLNKTAITKNPNNDYYIVYHNRAVQNFSISTTHGKEAWLTERNEQDFGILEIADETYIQFKAPLNDYELEIDTRNVKSTKSNIKIDNTDNDEEDEKEVEVSKVQSQDEEDDNLVNYDDQVVHLSKYADEPK